MVNNNPRAPEGTLCSTCGEPTGGPWGDQCFRLYTEEQDRERSRPVDLTNGPDKKFLDYITKNPGGDASEIADETGMSYEDAFNAESRLCNAGLISRA